MCPEQQARSGILFNYVGGENFPAPLNWTANSLKQVPKEDNPGGMSPGVFLYTNRLYTLISPNYKSSTCSANIQNGTSANPSYQLTDHETPVYPSLRCRRSSSSENPTLPILFAFPPHQCNHLHPALRLQYSPNPLRSQRTAPQRQPSRDVGKLLPRTATRLLSYLSLQGLRQDLVKGLQGP